MKSCRDDTEDLYYIDFMSIFEKMGETIRDKSHVIENMS